MMSAVVVTKDAIVFLSCKAASRRIEWLLACLLAAGLRDDETQSTATRRNFLIFLLPSTLSNHIIMGAKICAVARLRIFLITIPPKNVSTTISANMRSPNRSSSSVMFRMLIKKTATKEARHVKKV